MSYSIAHWSVGGLNKYITQRTTSNSHLTAELNSFTAFIDGPYSGLGIAIPSTTELPFRLSRIDGNESCMAFVIHEHQNRGRAPVRHLRLKVGNRPYGFSIDFLDDVPDLKAGF